MITLKKINSDHTHDFGFVQNIYIESFPPNERRPLPEFQQLMNEDSSFNVDIILEDEERVGFITHWIFDTFIYAEHFAIGAEYRNGGYGKKVMEAFLSSIKLPLVLEVELPNDEMAARRINFYERIGFKAWDIPYEQPPYEAKYQYLPMILMTYGNMNLQEDFEAVKETLYRKVYKALEV